MKISIRKSDKMWSDYLRKKIGKCERCNRTENLQVSHFWGRRNESVRFSEVNCDILCFSCHRHFHEEPNEYVEWKKKKLGDEGFSFLTVEKNTYCKRDDKLVEFYLKNLTKN